jgi:hypothetical protein
VAIVFEPLPLVIGITGHVDLRETDIPLLRKEVEAVLERLEREYANPTSRLDRMPGAPGPRAGATPMILLSALAEGADQLVVQIALARGLRVIAPLPLPVEAYRRDFEWDPDRPDVLMTFDAWTARPDIRKLFVGYEKGSSPEDVRRFGERRNLQYRRAGAFIARHCDVLIALWDGKTDASTGSAAEIVGFKRSGIPLDVSGSARAWLDAPEMGPVIHIVTPRAMKKDTTAVAVACWGAAPVKREFEAARRRTSTEQELAALDHDYQLWRAFEASIRRSREFNRDAARLLASVQGQAQAGQSFLRLFEVDNTKSETNASALLAGSLAPRQCVLYAVADALARRSQNVFWQHWRWLFGLGLFALGCFEAFVHLAPMAHAWSDTPLIGRFLDVALLSGYMAAVVAILILYPVAIRRRHQQRFLDYRAFAEALRVTVFWTLAGIGGAADAIPARMCGEFTWVKTCLLTQELFHRITPAGAAPRATLNPTSYDWIRRIWINGQLKYLRSERSKHLNAAAWRERWATALLFVVAALAAGLLLPVFREAVNCGQPAHDLLLFAIGILPGVAAILVAYSAKLAFHGLARHCARMTELFARALAILPATLEESDLAPVRAAVRELGAEAMRDAAGWVAMDRARSISLLEK